MPGSGPTAETAAPTAPAVANPRRWGWLRVVVSGAVAGLILAAGVEAGRVMLGNNLHIVLPGKVYRCAQLSPSALERTVEAYGIRTVVNLRGCCAPLPWYLNECRMTHRLDVAQEDVCLSAGRLPSAHELRRLVEVFDRSEAPLLLHCRRGADRTGMAAAIAVLLYGSGDLDQGCRQLGLRYGHVALGRCAYLDQFFDLYREWLRQQQLAHSSAIFRRWLEHGYDEVCRCQVEPLHFPRWIPQGQPCALRVRVRNTGKQTWHMQPETNAGIHLRFVVWNDHDAEVTSGRAGMFHEEVQPGQAIDLTLAMPALKEPGRYHLMVDMVDEPHCWFFQTGSEPLEMELEVKAFPQEGRKPGATP